MDESTLRGIGPDLVRERRDRRWRTAGLAVVFAWVAVGALGGFGVRSGTASAGGRGLHVDVRHATVARAGLAVPFEIAVVRPGGFDGSVEVSVANRYLQGFDENGIHPDPANSQRDRSRTTWTFDPPDGDELVVGFDVRVEPGVQWRLAGEVEVACDGRVVEVDVVTWIAP